MICFLRFVKAFVKTSPWLVDTVARHVAMAARAWVLLQEAADQLLTAAIQFAGAIRVRSVDQVDAPAGEKIEELLQLLVHGFVIAPQELVPPLPRACPPANKCTFISNDDGSMRPHAAHKTLDDEVSNDYMRSAIVWPAAYAVSLMAHKRDSLEN